MVSFLKKIFLLTVSEQEQKVLTALQKSEVNSRRVVGRGTLIIDVKDVTRTQKFKDYARQASEIVNNS